ncbi:MAG: hypothetical protein NT069_06230 [Planctomycetota bacterium]|nr:hypothetical protein [Planctomycetota bacterium]
MRVLRHAVLAVWCATAPVIASIAEPGEPFRQVADNVPERHEQTQTRPLPRTEVAGALERYVAKLDEVVLREEANPWHSEHDLTYYYITTHTNVLRADRETVLLTPEQRRKSLAQVVRLADRLVETEMSRNTCARRVRSNNADHFPGHPVKGWGYVRSRNSKTYAQTLPHCDVKFIDSDLTVDKRGDVEVPFMRYAYNDGHAVLGLLYAEEALRTEGIETTRQARYLATARDVLDDWLTNHSGTMLDEGGDLEGFFYEEFHDGFAYRGQQHQRLYWAVNSNAILGLACLEMAARSDEVAYAKRAALIAKQWKERSATVVNGAYQWLYAVGLRRSDEYVEDSTHAGVAVPFLAKMRSAPSSNIDGDDVAAIARAFDVIAPPPARTPFYWMNGATPAGVTVQRESLSEWGALTLPLRDNSYEQALRFSDAIELATGREGSTYYLLLRDSYRIAALAK